MSGKDMSRKGSASRRKAAEGELKESALTRVVAINGVEMKLDFDFERLVRAEAAFAGGGERYCNLLFCLSRHSLNVDRLQTLIACAAHTWQPKLTFDEGRALVSAANLYPLLVVVYDVLLIYEPQQPDGEVARDEAHVGTAQSDEAAA